MKLPSYILKKSKFSFSNSSIIEAVANSPSNQSNSVDKESEINLKIVRECQICCCEKKNSFFISSCHHEACTDCWREYLCTKIDNFQMAKMSCIACSENISYKDIADIFRAKDSNDNQERFHQYFSRYDKFLLEQHLIVTKNIFWCPYGCGFGLIYENNKSCPIIACKICQDKFFCSLCLEPVNEPTNHKCLNRSESRNISSAQNIISNLANIFQQITGAHLPIRSVNTRNSRLNRNDSDGLHNKFPVSPLPSISSRGSVEDIYQSCASSFSSINSLAIPRPSIAYPTRGYSKNQNSIAIQTVVNEEKSKSRRKKNKKFPHFNILEKSDNQPFIGENSESSKLKAQNSDPAEKDAFDENATSTDGYQYNRTEAGSSFQSQNPFKTEKPENCPGQMKQCPRCKTWVLKLKDGTCNHMYCGVCNCEFCWLCLREINSMHYLGPSGCTFWGREQWSVRKRCLLVIGLAIAAPTLLAILTAIALPCIIFGFPILIGRRVYQGFKGKPKHLRVWWTTLSILLSFIVAPLVAVLATAIGLIATIIFIYIYMPIASFTSYLSAKRNRNSGLSSSSDSNSNSDNINSNEEILTPSSQQDTSGCELNAHQQEKPTKVAPSSKALPQTIEWNPNCLSSVTNTVLDFEWDRLAASSKASKYALVYPDENFDSTTDNEKIEEIL